MTPAARARSAKTGLPPGTLVHIGDAPAGSATIEVIDYGPDRVEERRLSTVAEVAPYLASDSVTWVNVTGVHDVELVAGLGALFGVHPLVLEDVVNTHQRPKAEAYEGYLYLVVKMIRWNAEEGDLDAEQVSLLVSPNCVVTFQEKPGDVFDPVRDRIRGGKGKLRRSGADYLAYALLDLVVDHYFGALEDLDERVEDLEDELLARPTPAVLEAIHALKRTMITLRKAAWPLRELVAAVERSESPLIAPTTRPYLRDVYDHVVQVIDNVESLRDVLAGYLDIYLSSVSNRMNEVMKVLTVIATIFIPLTFLAGIYGMNFDVMPELHWPWAYPALWAVMAAVAGGLLWFFRRRGWL
ncbi:MAG: magnesium/cobalt transporter CorA [Deferrisomatales bacterium]